MMQRATAKDDWASASKVQALASLFTMGGDWRHIGSEAYAGVARGISRLEPTFAIAAASGLLTEPAFQTATARLEVFLHLVVTHARGAERLSVSQARRWLEKDLCKLPVRRMEDPPEDVFISNVIATGGNYRVFEGTWESSDKNLQTLLEAFLQSSLTEKLPGMANEILSLLRISDTVAERAGLSRWDIDDRDVPSDSFLHEDISLEKLAGRVVFTPRDLATLRIDPEHLAAFSLSMEQAAEIRQQAIGHTYLERRPLVLTKDKTILASPSSVSSAIRRYVLEQCADAFLLDQLQRKVRRRNAHVLFDTALPRVDAPVAIAREAMAKLSLKAHSVDDWDEVVCAFDVDKYAIVILLTDDFTDILQTGLAAPAMASDRQERLAEHIEQLAMEIARISAGGLVLVVYDGIGRGIALGLPELPERWHPVVISGPHFETLAASPEASLLRLWKLREQMSQLEKADMEIHESNGVLNTYAFWLAQHYQLVPVGFRFPRAGGGRIMPGIEFIRDVRVTERREHDPHAAFLSDGSAVAVRRYARSAFFPAMERRPLYGAEGYALLGELAGVYEGEGLSIWVWAGRPQSGAAATMTFRIWEAILSWLDRLVPTLIQEEIVPRGMDGILNVHIELSRPEEWESERIHELPPAFPGVTTNLQERAARIVIPPGFVALLNRPANDGERALLDKVTEGVVALLVRHQRGADAARRTAGVAATMRNAHTRFIHIFASKNPADVIIASQPSSIRQPRLVQPEDFANVARGLAWKVIDPDGGIFRADTQQTDAPILISEADLDKNGFALLTGRENCLKFYRATVLTLWEDIRAQLVLVNGPSLVRMVLQNLEWIHADREHWRRTARAVSSLYGYADDVSDLSAGRENDRAEAAASGRVLVEMAVCTCPQDSGREASLSAVDLLHASIGALMRLATDSDAIHGSFAKPEIRLHANGEPESDRTRIEEITRPFMLQSHAAEFRAASDNYEDLYEDRSLESPSSEPSLYQEPEFATAFESEFGITPQRVLDALGELADMAIERSALMVESTRGEVAGRLAAAREFSDRELERLFDFLALVPRPRWDSAPPGFSKRDWEPWRYRRRLSLAARPLVLFGQDNASPLLFGIHHLGSAITNLFANIRSAWLPEEFFQSNEMRAYKGAVAHRKGLAFAEEVAEAFRGRGWHARTQLRLTELGGLAMLGDIDVLAWSGNDARVLLVECKRLQPARTVREIIDVLREFEGEAGDSLGRHLRRARWVKDNPHRLLGVIGRAVSPAVITPLLVTNRVVPMSYRRDLPIAPEQIIPVGLLKDLDFQL
ncbi:MAG: hypothetical protein ACR2G6_06595 [Gemmatimonadaceae bacterium]